MVTKKIMCLLICTAWWMSGCAVNEVITAEVNELDVADVAPAEDQLLDIGIVEFNDGVPKNNDPVTMKMYDWQKSAICLIT